MYLTPLSLPALIAERSVHRVGRLALQFGEYVGIRPS